MNIFNENWFLSWNTGICPQLPWYNNDFCSTFDNTNYIRLEPTHACEFHLLYFIWVYVLWINDNDDEDYNYMAALVAHKSKRRGLMTTRVLRRSDWADVVLGQKKKKCFASGNMAEKNRVGR